MDYEKAYKEALKRAKILYNDKNEIGYANAESVLEEVFPLLKESDDERVRKEIIQSIKDNMVVIHKDECIAWLEKQAEQKPTLRERYKNIAESEWFKKTHNGMSVSNDEEPKWTDDDEKIRKWLIEYFKKINDEVDCEDKKKIITWLEKQGNPADINPSEFDLRLNKLLKQFETLPKEELANSLSFYLNVVQNNGTYNEEKQGEQKPTDKAEPKFHKGDWVFIEEVKGYKNGPFQIKTVDSFGYNFDECHIIIPFMYEELLSKWTIQDAREGDVLTNGNFPCIFKRCDGNGSLYVYCGINAHNDFSILSEDPENVWDDYSKQYFPATKEQRDLLFQKMKEAGYEWDAEKKELKKIEDEEYNGEDYGIDSLWHAKNIREKTFGSVDGYQTDDGILEHKCAIAAVNKLYKQKPKRMISAEAKEALYDKPDWSEKDENVLEDIEEAIINYWHGDTQDILLDWLKSLRPQNTWKPSEEQLKALELIINSHSLDAYHLGIVQHLYNDLKKLRKE